MRRLEIIHLRLTDPRPLALLEEIGRSLPGRGEPVSINVYRNAKVMSDIAIHLRLEADARDLGVTELGVRLASELRAYGMVEHAVWLEEPSVTGKGAI